MKVVIKNGGEEKTITVALPTALVLNPASAAIVSTQTEEFTYRQLNSLMKALRKSKKVLGGAPLVEVNSGDGDRVVVYL